MPITFIKAIVAFFILIPSFGASGQPVNPSLKKMSSVELRSGFLLLRDTMQKIHPAMYRYASKQSIDHIFDSCYASIQDSIAFNQFLTAYKVCLCIYWRWTC